MGSCRGDIEATGRRQLGDRDATARRHLSTDWAFVRADRRERIGPAGGVERQHIGPTAVEAGAGQPIAQPMRAGAGHAHQLRGVADIAGFEQRGEEATLALGRPLAATRPGRGDGRIGAGLVHPTG